MKLSQHFLKVTCLIITFIAWARPAHPFDQTHATFDQVLKNRVSDGWVNYTGLKSDPKALNDYLDQLAKVPEAEFKSWTEKERLAFLINLYNAATLKLIVDHYPVKSIKNIGGTFSTPWKQEVVHLFGKTISLDTVEHESIRPQYPDPRVHFALVCAARGCPPLRSEAFAAARLDEQLDDQGRVFLNQTPKNRVETGARTLYLSPIFKWYGEDFERKSGTVPKFVEKFLAEKDRRALAAGEFKIRYTDYDWSLNERAKK